jgi:hydroxyquinol 1,2-dioxygenase
MRPASPDDLMRAFVECAAHAPNERTRSVLTSLAAHLHAFVVETKLTHVELTTGLDMLCRAGSISTGERDEFALLSDMLAVTALVDMLNTPPYATSSSALGPFFQRNVPAFRNGGDLWRGQVGEPLVISGRIVDGCSRKGVADARIQVWQNADNGLYAAQDSSQPPLNYHGSLDCSEDGDFAFTTTRFRPYTVPGDGPVGEMLRALGRQAWRPAHLHLVAQAPRYRPLVTEFYSHDDPYLDSDAAFGVRDDLVVRLQLVQGPPEVGVPLEAASRLPPRFWHGELQIRLAPDNE